MGMFTRALPAQYRMLGQDAVLTPQGIGLPLPVRIMFSAAGEAVFGDAILAQPVARVQAAEAPAAASGDMLNVDGVDYLVRQADPLLDGAEVQLVLARA